MREYLDTYTDAGAQGGSAFLDVVDYRANADIQEELSSLDGGAYGQ
ncbi:MAG: hypothetical protein IKS18_02190 [Lachnospiraceae bacterium]|nr:hypothetical protein [Lachnospiraceae bacterium]